MSDPADRKVALQALLEIGRAMRAGGDLQPVLAAVASAVRRATGFGTVVINLHRPAWDDFEVVVVEGSAEARAVLMGATTRWEEWSDLLHERFDGAGYPRGLAGEAIPAEARILAVADAYEAMTADRPYRRAVSAEAARDELRRGAGAQFDARVVEAFLAAQEDAVAPAAAAVPAPRVTARLAL